MQIEIKIVGESTDQTFASVLEAISVAMGNFKASAKTPQKEIAPVKAEVVKETATEAVTSYEVAAASAEQEPEEAPAQPSKKQTKHTLESVRAEAVSISKTKRQEVKDLISKHGGVKVTDLSEDVYDAFMADLAKLKAQ